MCVLFSISFAWKFPQHIFADEKKSIEHVHNVYPVILLALFPLSLQARRAWRSASA